MHQIPGIQSIKKSASSIDFRQQLDTRFSTNKNLISSIKVPIKNLTFVEVYLNKVPLFSAPASCSQKIEISEKDRSFSFVSIIEPIILNEFRYDIFDQGLHQKLPFCGANFNEQIFCFDPCSRIMTVTLFHKVLFLIISIDIQTFNSQLVQLRFRLSSSQSKTQHPYMGSQLENHCFSLWH